jgi:hypothetical protein
MDALRNSKKILPPSCSHSLFIHIFQFDFVCTSYLGVRVSTLTNIQRERKTKLYYLGVRVITLTKDRRRLS